MTSHGAGMAVPDWPTTYGYNMFLFPISKWVGGVFYEHTHRLAASAVGLLTVILAAWLWGKESRRWLRWLGGLALVLVVLQGVLGGLRVVWLKDQIGIFHATLAQLFLVLVSAIALFTSGWWRRLAQSPGTVSPPAGLRQIILATTLVILGQLVVAATMRHQHAGLAIPDFPLAYHRLWPDTSAEAIARYNQQRLEVDAVKPITRFQIELQMAHRILAGGILILVATCAWKSRRSLGAKHAISKLTAAWLAMILGQAGLGAWTIWSNKAADVATAHVVLGAATLVMGAMVNLVALTGARAPVATKSETLVVRQPAVSLPAAASVT